MFLYPLGNGHNQIGCFKRRPDPEKNTYSALKCTPLEQLQSLIQNVAMRDWPQTCAFPASNC